MTERDRLSAKEIERHLQTRTIGRKLEIYESLDSTNNRAKTLAAQGAPHGQAVLAEEQSRGRGRRGRSFFSPPGTGVYFSCILRLSDLSDSAGLLTSLAAVAAARAVEEVSGLDVQIKWVNDLILHGKKLCGILCESGIRPDSGRLDWAVMGIGINVQPVVFPAEISEIATSIGNETGRSIDRNRLIAALCNHLENLLGEMESGAFLAECRRRSCVLGHEVTVLEGEKTYHAFAKDLDDRGRLVIERDGETVALDYGEVTVRVQKGSAGHEA